MRGTRLDLNRDRARQLASLIASARVLLGVIALTAPQAALSLWVGDLAEDKRAHLLGRVLGGRDLALGLGALLAIRRDKEARGWLEAGALADAGDTLCTLIAFKACPRTGRWAVVGASITAMAAGGWAAPAVDSPAG